MDDVDTMYVDVKVTRADVASTKVLVVPRIYKDDEIKKPNQAKPQTLVSSI